MQIQWYPGHMTKAKRQMQEDIRLVDLLIEVVDARIPSSSRNPDIDSIASGKSRVMILNKADLAVSAVTDAWIDWYSSQNIYAIACDSRNRGSVRGVQKVIDQASSKKRAADKAKGIRPRPARAMIAGIPNVGKSTFINSFAGKSSAKTGNKPGVTKGRQWVRLSGQAELLDTPGLLWPKFEDKTVGMHLAWIGSVNDEILDETEVALELIQTLKTIAPGALSDRYGLDEAEESVALLEQIGRRRGCMKKGGEIDFTKAGNVLLDDFRAGRLGRISLEKPPAI